MKLITLFIIFLSNISLAHLGADIYRNRCITCHGNPNDSLPSPILHGQEKRYLTQTINQFKSGERTDHLMGSMNNMAASLSDEEIDQVTTFLAAADICDIDEDINYQAPGWIEKFREGKQIIVKKNCMHCHDSFHHAAPRLYGQKKSYIISSIEAFQADKRPGFFKMIQIAKTLKSDEVEKIAHYLHGMKLMRDCNTSR